MALDGIVLSNIVHELKSCLLEGRIDKIYQPEKDDLFINVRGKGQNYKLLLTANSSYPRVHLSELTKSSSAQPPMFCMLLRKHIMGGRIVAITQPHFERIVEIHIEATNELGDKESKKLIIEMMGRHSNIILTKENYSILDSIKHISLDKSSVREVLPGKQYVAPPNQGKLDPSCTDFDTFRKSLSIFEGPIYKALYSSYSGLSPAVAKALCLKANIAGDTLSSELFTLDFEALYTAFDTLFESIRSAHFTPVLYTDSNEMPVDFYSFDLEIFRESTKQDFISISALLEHYYHEKSTRFTVGQKTSDIKKLVHTFVDRSIRKKAIQEKAIEESSQNTLYKIYGELLTSYSYTIPLGSSSFKTINYYSDSQEEISIPLEPTLNAIENAQKYFKHYSKSKRTLIAAKEQLAIIDEDLDYLQSILISLDLLETEQDINGLRQELMDMGYLKKRKKAIKKLGKTELPYMHFKASSGHDIYVGKNNYQNDQLTMKFAKPNDIWLHIKDGPGSHVIIKTLHDETLDAATLIEGAMLAAYFSKGKFSSNVAIDYTERRNVKKVPNAKPGMVIYNQFKTLFVTPDESFTKKLQADLSR